MVNNIKYTFPSTFEQNDSSKQASHVSRLGNDKEIQSERHIKRDWRLRKSVPSLQRVVIPPLNQLISRNSKRLMYIIKNQHSVQSCRNRDLPNFSQDQTQKPAAPRCSSRTKMDSLQRLNPFQSYKEQKKAEMFPI
jgi:hypothetical protein